MTNLLFKVSVVSGQFSRGESRGQEALGTAQHIMFPPCWTSSSVSGCECSLFVSRHYHWSVFHLRGVLVSSYITVWDTLASGLQIMITSELSRSWSMPELLPSTQPPLRALAAVIHCSASFNILYLLIPLKSGVFYISTRVLVIWRFIRCFVSFSWRLFTLLL